MMDWKQWKRTSDESKDKKLTYMRYDILCRMDSRFRNRIYSYASMGECRRRMIYTT